MFSFSLLNLFSSFFEFLTWSHLTRWVAIWWNVWREISFKLFYVVWGWFNWKYFEYLLNLLIFNRNSCICYITLVVLNIYFEIYGGIIRNFKVSLNFLILDDFGKKRSMGKFGSFAVLGQNIAVSGIWLLCLMETVGAWIINFVGAPSSWPLFLYLFILWIDVLGAHLA